MNRLFCQSKILNKLKKIRCINKKASLLSQLIMQHPLFQKKKNTTIGVFSQLILDKNTDEPSGYLKNAAK